MVPIRLYFKSSLKTSKIVMNIASLKWRKNISSKSIRCFADDDNLFPTSKSNIHFCQTSQLQQELNEAKCQVAESHKCRQKLEEDLRLIFLRGVSAMNIEALTAFGSSHKVNHKLGMQGRLVPSSRQQQSCSTDVTAPIEKTTSSSLNGLSDHTPMAKEPPPESIMDSAIPVVPDTGGACPAPTPTEVSVLRTNSSQAQYRTQTGSGWTRPTSTSGLRSAEMVHQHEFSLPVGPQSASRPAFPSCRPYPTALPTRKKSSNSKYQVEMQYMRSTVAASAARVIGGTSTRPVSVTRSPWSSSRTRRSQCL
ncbi:unnamed protein product [Phytophthora fragariaefolia]|uniref:Centrosomal protein POC5 n=1 Tax=Phytophthora fragariaefolia TaxID=1490495 RepID=A0A9W6YHV6_9STRA|nr:unnamed protein product [Phytophthora fragariaefolia]